METSYEEEAYNDDINMFQAITVHGDEEDDYASNNNNNSDDDYDADMMIVVNNSNNDRYTDLNNASSTDADQYNSHTNYDDVSLTLFEAVARQDHSTLLTLYAEHARRSIYQFLQMKRMWIIELEQAAATAAASVTNHHERQQSRCYCSVRSTSSSLPPSSDISSRGEANCICAASHFYYHSDNNYKPTTHRNSIGFIVEERMDEYIHHKKPYGNQQWDASDDEHYSADSEDGHNDSSIRNITNDESDDCYLHLLHELTTFLMEQTHQQNQYNCHQPPVRPLHQDHSNATESVLPPPLASQPRKLNHHQRHSSYPYPSNSLKLSSPSQKKQQQQHAGNQQYPPISKKPKSVVSQASISSSFFEAERLLFDTASVLSDTRPPSNFVVYSNNSKRISGNAKASAKATSGAETTDATAATESHSTTTTTQAIFDGSIANATPPPFLEPQPIAAAAAAAAAATTSTFAMPPQIVRQAPPPVRAVAGAGAGTILHLACALDVPLCLAFVLSTGADARACHTAFRRLMIHEAACNGSINCLQLLLELGQYYDNEYHYHHHHYSTNDYATVRASSPAARQTCVESTKNKKNRKIQEHERRQHSDYPNRSLIDEGLYNAHEEEVFDHNFDCAEDEQLVEDEDDDDDDVMVLSMTASPLRSDSTEFLPMLESASHLSALEDCTVASTNSENCQAAKVTPNITTSSSRSISPSELRRATSRNSTRTSTSASKRSNVVSRSPKSSFSASSFSAFRQSSPYVRGGGDSFDNTTLYRRNMSNNKLNFIGFLRLFRELSRQVQAGTITELDAARNVLFHANVPEMSRRAMARSCAFGGWRNTTNNSHSGLMNGLANNEHEDLQSRMSSAVSARGSVADDIHTVSSSSTSSVYSSSLSFSSNDSTVTPPRPNEFHTIDHLSGGVRGRLTMRNTNNTFGTSGIGFSRVVGTNREATNVGATGGRSDGHGNTPLHWAAFKNEVECVRLLLQYNADPNARAHPSGWTPLHDAAYSNGHESILLLLDAGAVVDSRANSGATPLCFAAQEDAAEAAALLLERGAKLAIRCTSGQNNGISNSNGGGGENQQNNISRFSGYTPLHYCAHYNAKSAARVLLQHPDAKEAMEMADFSDRLPIHVAVARGSSDVLRELLRAGARVETPRVCSSPSGYITNDGSINTTSNNSNNNNENRSSNHSSRSRRSSRRRRSDRDVAPAVVHTTNRSSTTQRFSPPTPEAPSTPRRRRTRNRSRSADTSTISQQHQQEPPTTPPVSSPMLRSMIPSQPVTSSKPWNCLSQRSIDECRTLITEVEQNWTPSRHSLFTPTDRKAVAALLLVGKRLESEMGIFVDVWPEILSFCGRGWFEKPTTGDSNNQVLEDESMTGEDSESSGYMDDILDGPNSGSSLNLSPSSDHGDLSLPTFC